MRIAVGIATAGRSSLLPDTMRFVLDQARAPDRVVACLPAGSPDPGLPGAVEIITSERGLPVQRNAIMDAVGDCDVLVFFDDDFFPERDFLSAVEAAHAAHADVAMTTGTVMADGIGGPGLAPEEAARTVATAPRRAPSGAMAEVHNAYGCNMSLSLATARAHGVRFDVRLPLYAWQEDVDFSRQMARHGRLVRLADARGVHLGAKSGRQSGVRLGYSQVVNPVYLFLKGTCGLGHVAPQIARNMAANGIRALRPEPYVDRAGRVRGNWLAILDLVRGRVTPGRILDL